MMRIRAGAPAVQCGGVSWVNVWGPGGLRSCRQGEFLSVARLGHCTDEPVAYFNARAALLRLYLTAPAQSFSRRLCLVSLIICPSSSPSPLFLYTLSSFVPPACSLFVSVSLWRLFLLICPSVTASYFAACVFFPRSFFLSFICLPALCLFFILKH